jgi:hypothetical protein
MWARAPMQTRRNGRAPRNGSRYTFARFAEFLDLSALDAVWRPAAGSPDRRRRRACAGPSRRSPHRSRLMSNAAPWSAASDSASRPIPKIGPSGSAACASTVPEPHERQQPGDRRASTRRLRCRPSRTGRDRNAADGDAAHSAGQRSSAPRGWNSIRSPSVAQAPTRHARALRTRRTPGRRARAVQYAQPARASTRVRCRKVRFMRPRRAAACLLEATPERGRNRG